MFVQLLFLLIFFRIHPTENRLMHYRKMYPFELAAMVKAGSFKTSLLFVSFAPAFSYQVFVRHYSQSSSPRAARDNSHAWEGHEQEHEGPETGLQLQKRLAIVAAAASATTQMPGGNCISRMTDRTRAPSLEADGEQLSGLGDTA